MAKHIFETGTRCGKRVQANGGAKNHSVVMPDADVSRTVEALSTAAFGCAGERCMAGSTAITVGEAAERLLPSLVTAARAIEVGPTDREAQPDMGRSSLRSIAIACWDSSPAARRKARKFSATAGAC